MFLCNISDSSFVTPVPSPAESYTSWPSPSSPPFETGYNHYNKNANNGVSNLYLGSTNLGQSTGSAHSGYRSPTSSFDNIEKHLITSKGLECSTEAIDDSSGNSTNLIEIPQQNFDQQQLPPTPPATPPNYRCEEIPSASPKPEVLKVLNNVISPEKETRNCLISQPNHFLICDKLSYSQLSPGHPQLNNNKVAHHDRNRSKIASGKHPRNNGRCKKEFSENNSETPVYHQCQDCAKVFKTKSNLNQHRNIVHKNCSHLCNTFI